MSISSKTPPTERAPKSATGSRACQAVAPAREAMLHSNIQLGIPPGILDQLQDAVFTTDLNGIITSCNRGVNRYGFEAKELVGKNIAALYGVEPRAFWDSPLRGQARGPAKSPARTKKSGPRSDLRRSRSRGATLPAHNF